MDTPALKLFLQSLCIKFPWNYAVFWGLQQSEDQLVLIYEDGYFDNKMSQLSYQSDFYNSRKDEILTNEVIKDLRDADPLRRPVDNMSCRQYLLGEGVLIYEDGYFNDKILQLSYQSDSTKNEIIMNGVVRDLLGADPLRRPVAFTIDNMLSRQYVLGEGLVGRVALTENDLWLYSDDVECTEIMSNVEQASQWLLSVAAGVKTTLLVPLSPFGVLQLGSFEKVTENLQAVAEIKDTIFALKGAMLPSHSNQDHYPHFCSSIALPEWVGDDELWPNPQHRNHCQDTDEAFNAINDDETLASYEIMVPFPFSNDLLEEDTRTISLLTSDESLSYPYMDLNIEADTLVEFCVPDIEETYENLCAFYAFKEEHVDGGVSSDDSSSGVSSDGHAKENSPEAENVSNSDCSVLSNAGYYHPMDLQEQIGSIFSISAAPHTGCSSEKNVNCFSYGWFEERGDHDHLLDAAIATLYNHSEDTVSFICNSRSPETSSEENVPSFQVQSSDETAPALKEHNVTSPEKLTTLSGHKRTFAKTVSSPSSVASLESSVLEPKQLEDCDYEVPNKTAKVPKFRNDKTERKGSHRPRPRDRQLIQDRLKELRKLVPNGAKCSIDGLLDHTTKHMNFLKSVAEQAKKVRQFSNKQLAADHKSTSSTRPCSKTSAQQVGSEIDSYPILVTDMEHQGQFLIQMLCGSGDVFFEMIEAIHQLKLTILQGVMETHRTNSARFIVEASEGFNKLDIFWPLMRILQRNGDWATRLNQWCP